MGGAVPVSLQDDRLPRLTNHIGHSRWNMKRNDNHGNRVHFRRMLKGLATGYLITRTVG